MMKNTEEKRWLNRTVLGVGLTSLFSDWSHETATAVLPAFLAAIGAGPAWLGAIEGIADGLAGTRRAISGEKSVAGCGRSAGCVRAGIRVRTADGYGGSNSRTAHSAVVDAGHASFVSD